MLYAGLNGLGVGEAPLHMETGLFTPLPMAVNVMGNFTIIAKPSPIQGSHLKRLYTSLFRLYSFPQKMGD
jgi:hypothetical protein